MQSFKKIVFSLRADMDDDGMPDKVHIEIVGQAAQLAGLLSTIMARNEHVYEIVMVAIAAYQNDNQEEK